MAFTFEIRLIVPWKIDFYVIQMMFSLKYGKTSFSLEEVFKCSLAVPNSLFDSLGTDVLNPSVIWMVRKEYIVQPFREIVGRQERTVCFVCFLFSMM